MTPGMTDRSGAGLEDMTVGAPRSAREALQSGAISLEALRAVHRMRDGRSALDVIAALASFVAVPVVFGLYPRWWTAALLALWAIRNFNCAAQLVHESDHGTLFHDPRLNQGFGNLFAYLLGYTRGGHRTAHMDHHLYLNTDRDPDIIFSQPEASASAMLKGLLGDLFLVSAVKRLLQYSQSDRATYSVSPWRRLTPAYFVRMAATMIPVAITQLALLALFTMTGGPWAYLLLHVLPIMTLYPLQIRVRSIAEHGFEAGYHPESPQEAWVTRTSRLNVVERWIIAPFGQYLHYEHHVFPSIPELQPARGASSPRGRGDPGAHESELFRLPVPEDPGRVAERVGRPGARMNASVRDAELTGAVCDLCRSDRHAVPVLEAGDYEYGVSGRFTLSRCTACDLYYQTPRPARDVIPSYYPPTYAVYGDDPVVGWLFRITYWLDARRVARLIGPRGRVLDVGLRRGRRPERPRRGGRVGRLRARARRGGRPPGGPARVQRAPGRSGRHRLPPESFDLIRMGHVIEHVRDPIATLRRARELLRPGGILFGETPNIDCWDFRLFGRYWGALHFPRHIALFSPETIRAACEQTGFVDTRIVPRLRTVGWSAGIQNWLADRAGLRVPANGRVRWYPALIAPFLPVTIFQALVSRTATMAFIARRPEA